MQLDHTHVKIRSRSLAEIGDLAFVLIRHYPQTVLIGFAIGVIPWLCIDWALLGWLPLSETDENIFDEETLINRWRYIWLLSALVFLQSPLAGIFATYFIGQAVFEQRPTWSSVIRNTLKIAPALLWKLGVLGGLFPAMGLLISTWGSDESPIMEYVWLPMIVFWALLVRAFRPFVPEVMVLERCPLRSKGKALTVARRSSLLHGPIAGELMGRFLIGGTLLTLLAIGLFYAGVWFESKLFNTPQWSPINLLVLLPLSLWIAAALATVMRFLSYLDSRIKLEGWEVELLLRAEAARQFGEREESIADSVVSNTQVGNQERSTSSPPIGNSEVVENSMATGGKP